MYLNSKTFLENIKKKKVFKNIILMKKKIFLNENVYIFLSVFFFLIYLLLL